MYIIFLDPDTHEVQLKFFSLRNTISQTSEGLMETFLETFQIKEFLMSLEQKYYTLHLTALP